MKKKILIACVVIAVLLCVIPIPSAMRDGGSIRYMPIVPIYQIYKYHAIWSDAEGNTAYKKGYAVWLFGMEVYENTYMTNEP